MTAIIGNTYPVKDQLKALGCRWNPDKKCWTAATPEMADRAKAIVNGQPVYNSPAAIPQDLGPVDATEGAVRHGRVPLSDKTVPFRRASAKGEKHEGETFWGKHQGKRDRYLVVRAGRPYYMRRDWLEDNDMFSTDPGWYCDVEAVAVEPTDDEIANDPAVAKAKKEARAKRRYEIERAVGEGWRRANPDKDSRMERHSLTGLTKCWGAGRAAGHEYLWSDGVSRLVYETSSYDDSPTSVEFHDAALAAEALSLKDTN